MTATAVPPWSRPGSRVESHQPTKPLRRSSDEGAVLSDAVLAESLTYLYDNDCGTAVEGHHELREACRRAIGARLSIDGVGLRRYLSRLIRDRFLIDTALEGGSGIEDACEFWDWLDQTMWPRPSEPGTPVQPRVTEPATLQRQAQPGELGQASGTAMREPLRCCAGDRG